MVLFFHPIKLSNDKFINLRLVKAMIGWCHVYLFLLSKIGWGNRVVSYGLGGRGIKYLLVYSLEMLIQTNFKMCTKSRFLQYV